LSTKKLQILGSINADTLDGKHASDFATTEQLDAIASVPPSTDVDNGKILRVVDGVATWVELPSASGVGF
jgi:hypothetical protein